MLKRLLVLLSLSGLLILTAATAFAAGGSGPGDALSPVGDEQTVAPHSALWFQFDVGHSTKNLSGFGRHAFLSPRSPVVATLDDDGASGVRLAIYTPEAISNWQNGDPLRAVGTGSSAGANGHDLLWTGLFSVPGTYYAVAYNDSDAAVTVKLEVTGDYVTTSANTPVTPTPAVSTTTTPQGEALAGKLVFVDAAGGNIYTANGDGTNLQRVSSGLDPQWSHSGTQIVLARQGSVPGIYVINADGSNERLLYKTNEPRSPDWSPDDSQIVFSYQANSKGGGQQCFTFKGKEMCFDKPTTEQWRLAEVNSSGSGYADVRATNNALTPTWNADGTTIAFNDLSIGIMQMSVTDDYVPFPFVGDLNVTAADYNPLRLMSPQYSPDGKKIVYVVQQQPAWQIAVANADGSDQHLLTSDDPLADAHPNNVAPVWSPDGKQILFLSNRNGKWEFFVMNVDGSNVHQVLKNVTDQITLNYSYNSDRMMSWTK